MAICAGCKRKSSEFSEYYKDNPVEDDGTYANNHFVCNNCYIILIKRGMDIGTPIQLQNRASLLRVEYGSYESNANS